MSTYRDDRDTALKLAAIVLLTMTLVALALFV